MGELRKFPFEVLAKPPTQALAVIFDLEGFSTFFAQPDVQNYVPRYLNRVFEALNIIFEGGNAYWKKKDKTITPLVAPDHAKFLGDGALFLWKVNETIEPRQLAPLLNRLYNLKSNFDQITNACADVVPVVDLPKAIRFGVARGTVYELTRKDGSGAEYIGYCINLASRLQNYCDQLGFIASARIGMSREACKRHGYLRVVATKLRGFQRELVIVDRDEYNELPADVRKELFAPAPNDQ